MCSCDILARYEHLKKINQEIDDRIKYLRVAFIRSGFEDKLLEGCRREMKQRVEELEWIRSRINVLF